MQKTIRQVVNFLLFSNLFIAFAAAAQVAFTYQILAISPNYLIITLVFLGTLGFYNFSILLAKPKNQVNAVFKKAHWVFANQGVIIALSLVAVLAAIIIALKLNLEAQLLLVILAILSAAYNLPLFKINNQKTGLRNIAGMKLLIIAGVWALSTVLLPVVETGITSLNTLELFILIIQRFLFIAAITLPFDIRDSAQDKRYALKTIPVLIGKQKSEQLCQLLLVLSVILFASIYRFFNEILMVNFLITAIAEWLILRAKWQKNEYYYFLYLDGLLIMPWLFIQGVHYFK